MARRVEINLYHTVNGSGKFISFAINYRLYAHLQTEKNKKKKKDSKKRKNNDLSRSEQ